MRLSKWLEEKDAFTSVVCEPKHDTISKEEFNIFIPAIASRVDLKTASKPDQESLELLLRFIKEVWASGNEIYYSYIMKWLSLAVQSEKTGTALVLLSEQGTGKGTLVEFISRYVLGQHQTHETAGISSITGRFNDCLEGKSLVVIDEMASTKDEFRSNWEKMKKYITDSTITVEPKGLPQYKIKNFAN